MSSVSHGDGGARWTLKGSRTVGTLTTHALVGAGFLPVWAATALMLVISELAVGRMFDAASLSTVLPLAAVLAVASLGEMLVIMTGGIDLSIPGTITLAGLLMVGVSSGENHNLAKAIVVVLFWSALIGFVNGVLVGVAGLNPLIVTLAVGWIVLGAALDYSYGIANESSVPDHLSSWATDLALGASWFFWVGAAIAVLLALLLRYTTHGRRFQVVGANPTAAWIAGIRVRSHVVVAYTAAGLLYGVAGILLSGFNKFPQLQDGVPYLLGPIAAVVIGGASLAGGRASVLSTWAAAFGLTWLNQMLRVLNLSTAFQYVVFGLAIAAGMVISGDRIVGMLGTRITRSGGSREGESQVAGAARREEAPEQTAT